MILRPVRETTTLLHTSFCFDKQLPLAFQILGSNSSYLTIIKVSFVPHTDYLLSTKWTKLKKRNREGVEFVNILLQIIARGQPHKMNWAQVFLEIFLANAFFNSQLWCPGKKNLSQIHALKRIFICLSQFVLLKNIYNMLRNLLDKVISLLYYKGIVFPRKSIKCFHNLLLITLILNNG